MRAITCSAPGGPQVLELADVVDPVPGPHDVLVDVVATAVNRADLLQRQGFYPPPPGASAILGLECAGRVAAVGTEVGRWKVGDEICALLPGGGYAELALAHADHCLPVPEGTTLAEAAALPEAVCTVWSNLVMVARLSAGNSVLIHGGASGIGTTAIQVAKRLGARVLVTAGSPAKVARCMALGADEAIDYRDEDFGQRMAEVTGGRGVDVVLDIIGAKYLSQNLACLAPGGRLVVIGLQGGTKAELDLGALLVKCASVTATALRSRPVNEKSAIVAEVLEHVWPMISAGSVRPVVDRRLPLAEAAEAHRVVAASEHVGKVLLDVGA
ncbi:MAG TPA: NAD(P)H-quinone oxidoreductase [Mycobacteriales bacterium]|nr:NAD(P)H-quinone oxidoreductase [Mycobacteriales bacterium]